MIESEPTGSRAEVKPATPSGFSLALPSVVEPLAKVTVPVGKAVPEPDAAATVATSSMGAPFTALAAEAVRVTVLANFGVVTVTVTALEVEDAYGLLPP